MQLFLNFDSSKTISHHLIFFSLLLKKIFIHLPSTLITEMTATAHPKNNTNQYIPKNKKKFYVFFLNIVVHLALFIMRIL